MANNGLLNSQENSVNICSPLRRMQNSASKIGGNAGRTHHNAKGPEKMSSTITVYTKPACIQCRATFRELDKNGIAYETVDVTQDDEARDYLMSLGYLAVPVVHISPDVHWQGHRPDRVASITAA